MTGYFDGYKKIGDKYGLFDVTMLETGAYDKQWPDVRRRACPNAPCTTSKEDLFAETLVQLFHSKSEVLDIVYRPDTPLRAQLQALLHSPQRARPIVARIGEREEGVTTWVRAAQADGRLKQGDPLFAATMLHGQLKAVAFWPQVAMGAPPLDAASQDLLVDAAVSMFLSYFACSNETA